LLARTLPRFNSASLALKPVWAILAIALIVTIYRVNDGLPPHGNGRDALLWINRPGVQFTYPIEAANYVDAHVTPRTHRLINGFNFGGYLCWRLSQYQMMADARTQLYSPEFIDRTFSSDEATTRAALVELDAQHQPDAAILPRGDQHFVPRLRELGWRVTFQDEHALVLEPNR
jgi:hypothetical protein